MRDPRTLAVEARGIAILEPFLDARGDVTRWIVVQNGRLATNLQKAGVDFMINDVARHSWPAEAKFEDDYHSNFFIEVRTWGGKGWFFTETAPELLLYLFVKHRKLFVIRWPAARQWLLAPVAGGIIRLETYRLVPQNKYEQNDTWGRLVPINDMIRAGLSSRCLWVSQHELFPRPFFPPSAGQPSPAV